MKILTILIFTLSSIALHAQDITVTTVTPLDGTVWETSGLIWVEDRLITHNDSGGGHKLYEIDTVDGEVIRTVVVANAASSDWEDICYDEAYIYIGDIGNNAGTRTDLRIFRVSIEDYITTPNDTVYCDTIAFNYSDQTDFEPAVYTTNYDAEAIIAHNDSLYLFSKNWGNLETNVYAIPKEPGTYTVSIVDNFDTNGLVTGAAYDPEKNEVLLCGYNFVTPFLFFIKGFSGNQFSEGNLLRSAPSFEGSFQIEGSTSLGNHGYFVSSEQVDGGASILHRVDVRNFVTLPIEEVQHVKIYPTQVKQHLNVSGDEAFQIQLFTLNGKLVASEFGNSIDLSSCAKGSYIVRVMTKSGNFLATEKVVKL